MNPVVHFELPAENRERVSKFYKDAFGWTFKDMGEEMNNYLIAHTGDIDENGFPKEKGIINGGIYEKSEDTAYHHPSFVISVNDFDKAVEKIKSAGGKLLGEPMDIPGIGKYISFYDTENNRLSILKPVDM